MSTGPVNGMFRGLAEGAVVDGTGGMTISYFGGTDGFDVVIIPAPATGILLANDLLLRASGVGEGHHWKVIPSEGATPPLASNRIRDRMLARPCPPPSGSRESEVG